MRLSERLIKSFKWNGNDQILSDGGALYLNVRRSSKTFIVRKRRKGRMFVTTLGRWKSSPEAPGLTLLEARAKAAQMALEGAPTDIKVHTLVEKFQREIIEKNHKRPELADGYWRRAVIPAMGSKRVVDIKPIDIANIIETYAKENGARTADQLRTNIKSLFGYAVELGIIPANPALHITSRITGYRYKPRERVLSDDEIRLIWNETKPNARILRFLLLTSLRISEAQKGGTTRTDDGKWHVEAEFSKNGRPHWVFLTDSALEQLPLPSSTATNIQAWLRRWCDKHNISPAFTPHDLRRTAATRMAHIGIEPFIVERVLNHTLQGVMGIYNKAEYEELRIEAARALESHIQSILINANDDHHG